jgi:RHS repeat-associated protein
VTDETVSYDRLGNIATLSRNGQYNGAYNYNYTSQTNQLATVTNQTGGSTFKSYGYDGNGNATSDGGTKMITYNILNLPQTVTQSGSTLVTYYYDADGNKLRTESPLEGQMDYLDNIVYANGSIAFIQTEEGKAMPTSGNDPSSTGAFDYVYDKKDYLGNVRASYDNGGNVNATSPRLIQENDYYPFGLTTKYSDVSNGNRYLYNGKEQQFDLSYQYDFGARFYDPVIARWTSLDPIAEKYANWSPYIYVKDNPISFFDFEGGDVTPAQYKDFF